MDARLDMLTEPIGKAFVKGLLTASAGTDSAGVPYVTLELVRLRASQINGCAYCVDMHSKDATHAGETPGRLNLVAVWREATVFTEAERAALELAEQGTRLADTATGVTDDAWANAARHYDVQQLAALVVQIAVINAFNRANVMLRTPAGDYVPGQWAH